DLRQNGQNAPPDVVATEGRIFIGSVLAPGDAAPGEPLPDGRAAETEQGPDQASFRLGPNSAEAGGSRTAEESEQHGFGLVIQRVAGRDTGADLISDRLGEEFIAKPPRFLLDVAG